MSRRAFAASLVGLSLVLPDVVAAQDTSTVQGFEAAFRHANASKDFRRVEQLVWGEHTKPETGEDMRNVLRQAFGHPVRRIDIGRFSWAQAIYPPRNPNLKPTHFFTVWSVTGRDRFGTQITGTFYTLGRKDGRFYFLVSDQRPVMTMHYEGSPGLTKRLPVGIQGGDTAITPTSLAEICQRGFPKYLRRRVPMLLFNNDDDNSIPSAIASLTVPARDASNISDDGASFGFSAKDARKRRCKSERK